MGLILAVDAGTTNLKAGAVDARGRVVATAQRSMRVHRGADGKAEHDPGELFRALAGACREASRGRASLIEALVLSTYQMGLLAVDARMSPLGGIATLLDTRPRAGFAALLRRPGMGALFGRTGYPAFALSPLARLAWMRRARPALFRRTALFLGSKDWLLWKLTGEISAEMSVASATGMLDFRSGDWDDAALRLAGLDAGRLPRVTAGNRVAGLLTGEAALATGLPAGTPVVSGVYDGGALALGLGGLKEGVAVINLGTSAMFRVPVRRPVLDSARPPRISTVPLLPGVWLAGAGVNNAGNAVEWFMRNFEVPGYPALDTLARSARVTADSPLAFPFLTGERDPRLAGWKGPVFRGARNGVPVALLAHAVLEGVVHSLRLVGEALRGSGLAIREVRAGGGGTRLGSWVQLLADCLGAPVRVVPGSDPTLAGSAMLARTVLGGEGISRLSCPPAAVSGTVVRPRARFSALRERRFALFLRAMSIRA